MTRLLKVILSLVIALSMVAILPAETTVTKTDAAVAIQKDSVDDNVFAMDEKKKKKKKKKKGKKSKWKWGKKKKLGSRK